MFDWNAPLSIGSSALDMSGLAGAGALGGAGAAGGAAAGLGAALGPIGLAGLGLQGIGMIGNLFGGNAAADQAKKDMAAMRQYQVGANTWGQLLPRHLDYVGAKEELALANSPAARQLEARDARFDLAGKYMDKYGPAMGRRMTGGLYGA